MEDKPDWAFGDFSPEAVSAKSEYYSSLFGPTKEERLSREEARLRAPVRSPNAKPERNGDIWRERVDGHLTLEALAKKYGITRERVRQIVAKESRRRARLAYFNELRKEKGGASNG